MHTIDFNAVVRTLNRLADDPLCELGIENAAAYFGLPHKDECPDIWGDTTKVEPIFDTCEIEGILDRAGWHNHHRVDMWSRCKPYLDTFAAVDTSEDRKLVVLALLTEFLGLTELEGRASRKRKKA